MQTYQANPSQPAVNQVANDSGRLEKWKRYLGEPIDGASLAVFRICFGLAMLVNVVSYSFHIDADYLTSAINFSLIPGLHPWPGSCMYEHFAIMGAAAICIAIGIWCRPAALIFCLGQTYLLLLEKAHYQNHNYLICLLAFLLFLTPSNRVWSLDNKEGSEPRTVPRWSVLIFKAQIFIVYFYGGVAKLNPDWLRGEPVTTTLQSIAPQAYHGLGAIVCQPWFCHLVTFGGIAVDFSLGFLLWCPFTFWFGAAVALAFHIFNSILFPIGIFPWVMIATIGLFAAPNWPRRIFQLLFKRGSLATAGDASISAKQPPAQAVENEPKGSADVMQTSTAFGWTATAMFIFLHVYILLQVLIPLRHFLYPGDVAWTEQGHRFSWRMMLRSKEVKEFKFLLTDPRTQKTLPFNISKFLTRRQYKRLQTSPNMILQMAHFIADGYEAESHVRPIVKVVAVESLNYRAPQNLIDPNVDLAAQPESLLPASWIVPLQPLTAAKP